jgi:hypothetical protein
MTEVITWLGANWTTVVGSLGTIVMASSLIVRGLSPFMKNTDKDEKAAAWLDKVYNWLNTLAINPK